MEPTARDRPAASAPIFNTHTFMHHSAPVWLASLAFCGLASAQSVPVDLAELDRVVLDQRTVDANGTVIRQTVDAQTGVAVDLEQLRRANHAAALARRGKLAPTLAAALDEAAAAERMEVAFWLVEPEDGFDAARHLRDATRGVSESSTPGAIRAVRLDLLTTSVERHEPNVETFASAARAADADVLLEGFGWPLVIASVRADRLLELARHPLVDEVYKSQPTWAPEGESEQGTLRTYDVHDQGTFTTGDVKVLVNDTSQVQLDHPFLPPTIALNSDGTGSHATGVAGNIANIHPTHYAASFTLPEIYTAGGTGDVIAPQIWSTAIAEGIDFGNCSWWNFLKGEIEFLDRFFDYTVRNFGVMMFKSNGNQGNTSTPYGTTPGQGYNVTCTGNYSDQDNVSWLGDNMASSSSYWNPLEGHEKPEIASPGDCVVTTTTGGGLTSCFGGTSSASPLTCGVAALIASANTTLLAQMTTVKAALMVSAWHNIEGAALLSDRDGAGGVHAKAAHAVVRDGQWWHDVVTPANFSANVLDVPMDLPAGQEARVIALWFSNANSSYSTDVLDMDLDMAILSPSGAVVASSASTANPFELASFVAPESGTYIARLTNQRFDGTSEPLTVAWSSKNDAGQALVEVAEGSQPFAIGSSPSFLLRERYTGAGSPYRLLASITPGAGNIYPGGFAQPVVSDGVTAFVQAIPGFIGLLDANGEALVTLPIPELPSLVGTNVFFGGALLGSDGIQVSDPVLELTLGS